MTRKHKADAERAVQRGVRLLDRTLPDWAAKIDLRLLNMDQRDACVLGHCYGDFWHGLFALGKPTDNRWAIRYGFNAAGTNEDEDGVPNGLYEYLALCWAHHIAKRQVAR